MPLFLLFLPGEGALGFMKYYLDMVGDPSPEGSRILLPVGITAKTVYDKYRHCHPTSSGIKESHFYALWKEHFGHVSYQKVCNLRIIDMHMLKCVFRELAR